MTDRLLWLTAGLAATAVAFGATSPAHAEASRQTLTEYVRFPAGPLSQGLEAVALRFNLRILYDPHLASGHTAGSLEGRLTAEEALNALLVGQPLRWERTSRNVIVLRPAEPAAREIEPFELDPVVVSASRTPRSLSQISSSVGVISPQALREQQIGELRDALAQQPGVTVANTGNAGGAAAVYLRGAYAHHTLLIIDGVRMNDRAAAYNNFMSAAGVEDFERVEVLRGPQSPLYGSSAIGGVILADTLRGGVENAGASLSASAGSFGSTGLHAMTEGGKGGFGYSLSLDLSRTDNALPDNGYQGLSYSGRLEYAATPRLDVGMTFRAIEAEYESVGSRYLYAPGTTDSANYLATVYADWRTSDSVTSRGRLGFHRREYLWSSPALQSEQTNGRLILDWQTAWKPDDAVEVVGGANLERSTYDINAERTRDHIISGFLSTNLNVSEALTVNAGMRRDDYASVGDAFTWRTGFAWRSVAGIKFRGTYGTGFAAPGSSDRYGVAAWRQLPNPDIRPETSQGWDIGLDTAFLSGAVALSASYFHNQFRGLIDWRYTDPTSETGQYFNRNQASARGVELGLTLQPGPEWQGQFSYTYLDARDDDSGARLPRRPRHSGDLSIRTRLSEALTLGAGARLTSRRPEGAAGYATTRIFASYALGLNVTADVRVENLLDAKYDEVDGYPGLPRGVHFSLTWRK